MIRERLLEIDVDIRDIEAVLVTHEHTDHIKGLEVLASSLGIPIFANSDTAKHIHMSVSSSLRYKIFSTDEPFEFGDLKILPFSIQHDAVDPVAFVIEAEGIKMGICTDLGFATKHVVAHLQGCDFLYLEANHEPSMVHASSRPDIYKKRVLSRQGHLSNDECATLLAEVLHAKLKHVHLAHLSSECNAPLLALDKIGKKVQEMGYAVEISIAHQDMVSKKIIFQEV